MKLHWTDAMFLLENLAKKLTDQDEDGLDLRFTCDHVQDTSKKDTARLRAAVGQEMPSNGIFSNIYKPLSQIFEEYLEKLDQYQQEKNVKRQETSKQTAESFKRLIIIVIVFTDDGLHYYGIE